MYRVCMGKLIVERIFRMESYNRKQCIAVRIYIEPRFSVLSSLPPLSIRSPTFIAARAVNTINPTGTHRAQASYTTHTYTSPKKRKNALQRWKKGHEEEAAAQKIKSPKNAARGREYSAEPIFRVRIVFQLDGILRVRARAGI